MPTLSPPAALAFNFISAVGLIMINQYVFTRTGFDFPVTLSTIHFVATLFCLQCLKSCGLFSSTTSAMRSEHWLLSLAKGLGTPLNNLALRHNSIGVAQISKLMVTPALLLLHYIWFGERISLARFLWVTLCGLGVFWATVTDVEFPGIGKGTLIVLIWLPCSIAYKTLTSRVTNSPDPARRLSELQLLYMTLPWSIAWSILAAPFVEDWQSTQSPLGFELNPTAICSLALSAAGAVLVNLSGSFLLCSCHPLSHVLLGQAKTCALLLGGWLMFGQTQTAHTLGGAAVAMGAIVGYTATNLAEQEHPRHKRAKIE